MAVEQEAEHLDLDTDAATLHLRLLVLPLPTDARLRTVNGWRAPSYEAALPVLPELFGAARYRVFGGALPG